LFGCSTSRGIVQSEPKELKMVIHINNEREYLRNFILYKKYDVEMIDTENYLVIKNINEEILIELHRIIHLKMDLIAINMANINTTRTENGEPYIRKYLKITAENGIEIIEDMEIPLRNVYDPTHPDAITTGELKGYVKMPNVDIVTEMIDMIETARLYEGILEYSKNIYKNIIW
jgi:flagellar basal-body rod protein FlgC